jgi:Plasmid maintenance system antidote protein
MQCLNLKGEMAKRSIKVEDIAHVLQIHRNSASNKINGDTSFSIDEAVKVKEAFFPELSLKFLSPFSELCGS